MRSSARRWKRSSVPAPTLRRRWKALGKEMEAKFGPGSDFEKKMEAFGKEMEAKFGPGSDFEKKMKELGQGDEAEVRSRLRVSRRSSRRNRVPAPIPRCKSRNRSRLPPPRREPRTSDAKAEV